jgi:putative redox protein
VLRFDFTGLGNSEGTFAEHGFSGDVADLIAAAKHMAEQGLPLRLLIGHSLGGAAVLAAAGQLPEIKAVATLAAPFDVNHVTGLFKDGLATIMEKGEAKVNLGGRPFTIRRSFVEDLRNHDQGARTAKLTHPLLVMHSPVDQIVGVENAAAIFQAARHPKSYISLDHADHLLTNEADAAYAADVIAAWASRFIGAAEPAEVPGEPGKIVVQETGGGKLQVQVVAGKTRFYADEPVEVGGLGSGPNPYDLLCAALGACTSMTVRLYAEHKQWPLSRMRVAVAHHKDKDLKPVDRFSREITIEGNLDPEQRARLLEIAERCPVHRTLEGGSAIETRAKEPVSGG